jgi:hypothetical protein
MRHYGFKKVIMAQREYLSMMVSNFFTFISVSYIEQEAGRSE